MHQADQPVPQWSHVPCETCQLLSCVNRHLEMSGACLGFLTGNSATPKCKFTRRGSYGAEAAGTAEQTEQASQGFTWEYKGIKNHKRNGQCQRDAELFWPKIQVNCVSVNLRTAFPTAYRGICKEVWRRPWKLKVNLFPSYFQIFLPNLLIFFSL